MPFIVGGAILGGAFLGAKGASKAADAQGQASSAATAEQARQYDLSRADLAPYRTAGNEAIGTIQSMLGLGSPSGSQSQSEPTTPVDKITSFYRKYLARDPEQGGLSFYMQQAAQGKSLDAIENEIATSPEAGTARGRVYTPPASAQAPQAPAANFGELNKKFTVADFQNDPVTQLGLKYGLDLGRQAIDRGAGATGLRNSGATLKALTRFGQDYGGSKAAESSARFYGDQDRVFNRLSSVAGTGQTATNAGVLAGQNYATNVGNILTAQGNARGAAAIGQANAYGGALNTIGNYYGQQATLDKILNRGGVAGSSRASSGLYDIS